jgi:hypothetical protein
MRFRKWLSRQWERRDVVGELSRSFMANLQWKRRRDRPQWKRWLPRIINTFPAWADMLREGQALEHLPALVVAWKEYDGRGR